MTENNGVLPDFAVICRKCGFGARCNIEVSPFGSVTMTCLHCGIQNKFLEERDEIVNAPPILAIKKNNRPNLQPIERVIH